MSAVWENAAAEWEFDAANPVGRFLKSEARRSGLKESPPKTRYLSHDEERRLLSACQAPGLADHVAFAIETGLRTQEQFGLTWRDVNLSRRELVIEADRAKSGRERRVPISDRAAQILAQLPRRLRPAGGPDWVFCKSDGDRYQDRRKAFIRSVAKSGIAPLTWHDLRRTCGCRLLQDHGLTMDQVRMWLGHASVSQTESTYAFLRVDDLKRAAQIPAQGTRIKTR